MMTVLYNPLRLLQQRSLASYPSVFSFYQDFLKRLWKHFPKGMIDAMNFIECETPYKGKVLYDFCNDFSSYVTPELQDWFFDKYILKINWHDKHECRFRLKWLAETLIIVVNHHIEPCWTVPEPGNCFDDAFESFYTKNSWIR